MTDKQRRREMNAMTKALLYCIDNNIVVDGEDAINAMTACIASVSAQLADRIDNGTARGNEYEALSALVLASMVVRKAVEEDGIDGVTLSGKRASETVTEDDIIAAAERELAEMEADDE